MKTASASAPGKFVILGEHAVVFGKPAVAVAIDRRFKCTVSKSDRVTINGEENALALHPHILSVLDVHGHPYIEITTESDIPSGSGLGSSAALAASFSFAVRSLLGEPTDSEAVAKEAYEAEYSVQGIGSPMDTSASVHGMGIAVNAPEPENLLWRVERGKNVWDICGLDVPEMTFVIGYTGKKALTGPLVEKVRRYKERNSFAKDIIDEIGTVTLEGMDAIKKGDRVKLGDLMTKDHKLLSILGVSGPELNKLVDAVSDYSYGAKLTGAGGGGSMVALTDEPEKVSKAISSRGGTPITVKTGEPGVRAE